MKYHAYCGYNVLEDCFFLSVLICSIPILICKSIFGKIMNKKYFSTQALSSIILALMLASILALTICSCASTSSNVSVKEDFSNAFKKKASGKKIMGYGNRTNQEFGSFNSDATIFEVGDGRYNMYYRFSKAESANKATYSGYNGEAGFAIDFVFDGDNVLSMLCYIEKNPSESQDVVKTINYVLLEDK